MKTEHPQTLDALQTENDKFRLILENIMEGVAVVQNGRIVFHNPAVCHIFGATPEQLLARDIFTFAHRDEQERAKINYEARMRGEIAEHRAEYRLQDRNGEEVWADFSVSRILWENEPALLFLVSDVSVRKQNQFLAEAMDASNDGVWFANMGTGEFRYSRRWGEIHGYEEGEALDYNRLIRENVHPDDEVSTATRWRLFLDGQTPAYENEFRLRGKDGRYRWLYSRAKIIGRDADGAPERIIGVHSDITGRRQAQEENRLLKERLQGMFDHLSIGVAVYEAVDNGEDFRFLDFNKAAETISRVPRDKVIGRTLLEVFPQVASAGLYGAMQKVWRTGKPLYIPPFFVQVGDRQGWRESRIYRIPSKEVVTLFEDVTPRMRAQEALRQSESDLRRAHRLARIGAWSYSFDADETVWSDELYDISGYAPGEIRPTREFARSRFLHPDNRDALEDLVSELAQSGSERAFTGKIVRKDGAVRWMKTFAELETDATGAPFRIVAASQDVTELMEAELELKDARDRAEEANRVKTAFLANMSHEIRTPLNGVMGMLQILMTTRLDQEQTEITDISLKACERLHRLLSDILDWSCVEAGEVNITREPFDLREIMDFLSKLFAPAAAKAGLGLECSAAPDIPSPLLGDGGRVQQILNNLVGNAIKFSSKGAIVVHAQRLSSHDPKRVPILFSIRDEGRGISPEELDRIFEPFAQADLGYSRQHQGAGLGLSIVKRLVHRMGGNISVSSAPGQGAEFLFRLNFDLGGATPPAPFPEHGGQARSGLRILAVEDDEVGRLTILRILDQLQAIGTTAVNGVDALEKLRQGNFDLILMDVQMPEMDGIDAVRAIRAGQAGADKAAIPVVALTAYVLPGDRERFLAEGMSAYLAKPINLETLQKTLWSFFPRPDDAPAT